MLLLVLVGALLGRWVWGLGPPAADRIPPHYAAEVARLRHEVDRLNAEVLRLNDEQRFMMRLLAAGQPSETPDELPRQPPQPEEP